MYKAMYHIYAVKACMARYGKTSQVNQGHVKSILAINSTAGMVSEYGHKLELATMEPFTPISSL